MESALSASVGIIGAGSMGGSIARGLVSAGAVAPDRMFVADHNAPRRDELAALGAHVFEEGSELAAEAPDVVILAVKPQVLPQVLEACAPGLSDRLVISIAAGVPIRALEAALPSSRVVRAMPNLPVKVRSGATVLAAGSLATAEDVELARAIFATLGAARVMREDQLDVSGAVVGTAPAFFSLFVDTLTRAGVRAGLPAQACRELLETTMRGCAEQLLSEGVHPRAYMERVTSPGGTTAAALRELEPLIAEGSEEAVDAALARTRELAEG